MRWATLLAVLVLTACASQPASRSDASGRGTASARVHTELAALYYERGQFGVALEEIDLALNGYAEYAPAFTMRALIRMALREDAEAESDFVRSLKLDPASSEAHNNYGWFLCQRGREKESLVEFTAALKNPLYQTPEKALVNAGICARRMGDGKSAEDFLQRALMASPRSPEALVALAELNFEKGDWAGAKSYFMKYEQTVPDALSAANLWLAVRIERKLGRNGASEEYAQRLRRLYPDARETQLMLYGR
ncbi:type IV pilus biogenesis/stability protein PilW [Ferriphaselus sp. R-1]|uniref:type IV pilus biogenesis/stability protein PilW n=1 Tax=Ferriphaselus sp. R-1 TaxID=1485544 RepID=UPI000556EEF8|nr:type IV pilus biogenesis/stability protein PilW [Ferriphaselus sp. R-1]